MHFLLNKLTTENESAKLSSENNEKESCKFKTETSEDEIRSEIEEIENKEMNLK
jgi:hypothetical protein